MFIFLQMTRKDVTCSAGLENGISRTSSSTETSKARKGATRSENQEKMSKSQSHTNSKQMKLKYPYKEGSLLQFLSKQVLIILKVPGPHSHAGLFVNSMDKLDKEKLMFIFSSI